MFLWRRISNEKCANSCPYIGFCVFGKFFISNIFIVVNRQKGNYKILHRLTIPDTFGTFCSPIYLDTRTSNAHQNHLYSSMGGPSALPNKLVCGAQAHQSGLRAWDTLIFGQANPWRNLKILRFETSKMRILCMKQCRPLVFDCMNEYVEEKPCKWRKSA